MSLAMTNGNRAWYIGVTVDILGKDKNHQTLNLVIVKGNQPGPMLFFRPKVYCDNKVMKWISLDH